MDFETKNPEKAKKGYKLWHMIVAFVVGTLVASAAILVPAMGGAGFIGFKQKVSRDVPMLSPVSDKTVKKDFGTVEGTGLEEIPYPPPPKTTEGTGLEEIPYPPPPKTTEGTGLEEIPYPPPPKTTEAFGEEEEVPPVDLKGFDTLGREVNDPIPWPAPNTTFDNSPLLFDLSGNAYKFDSNGNAYIFDGALDTSVLNVGALELKGLN